MITARKDRSTAHLNLINFHVSITHHLQVGDPMLPPQVLLELWSHSREHVVEVHHDVHERVDNADECSMSTREVFCAAPRDHGHDGVMVQMQERYLVVLLSQHKEDRIEQFREFGYEVNVAATRFLRTRRLNDIAPQGC